MGQKQPVDMGTSEEIKELILNGPPYLSSKKPFLTMSDIASELDVSKETVRNNIDSVTGFPWVRSESVGQANVYWRAYEPEGEWSDVFGGDEIGEDLEEFREEEITSFFQKFKREQQVKLIWLRANWLQSAQDLLDASSDPVDPEMRLNAWDRLTDYLQQLHLAGRVSFSAALNEKDIPPEYEKAVDVSRHSTEGDALSDGFQHLNSIVYDTPLFTSPLGVELKGVVMLFVHHQWLKQQIDEETPEARRDELLPSAKDIHHAGEVLDRLGSQLHGFYW